MGTAQARSTACYGHLYDLFVLPGIQESVYILNRVYCWGFVRPFLLLTVLRRAVALFCQIEAPPINLMQNKGGSLPWLNTHRKNKFVDPFVEETVSQDCFRCHQFFHLHQSPPKKMPSRGGPGGSAVEHLPLAQGVTPGSWDRVPPQGACISLRLCLSLSLSLSLMNK